MAVGPADGELVGLFVDDVGEAVITGDEVGTSVAETVGEEVVGTKDG